ncbi:MAG: diadenylate cyclase CdaA [Oscillospiraceae bacterium]|nr:diadenylate cyclase CdaA [Oscillospiraceae bacterium]
MSEIKNYFSEIFSSIPVPGFMDIVDILVVAYLLYRLIRLVRTTSAFRIAKAIIIFFVVTGLTGLLHMYAINYILKAVMEVGIIALVVMFQPELRRMLDHLGGSTLQDLISGRPSEESMAETIRAVASACGSMSRDRIGALIVFERANALNDYFKTGTVIEADCSDALLRSIFFPNSALHDGAVILSGARIAAAGCVLPLTEKTNLSKDLGTRHRAGIGMSEANDSVVVIVSEESGTISVAEAGMLKRNLTEETLARLLTSELVKEEEKKPETVRDWIKRLFSKNWKKG